MRLERSCLRCNDPTALSLHHHHIICGSCGYTCSYPCMFCQNPLSDADFKHDISGPKFHCKSCQNHLELSVIKDCLENGWKIQPHKRCDCGKASVIHVKTHIERCITPQNCQKQSSLFSDELSESYVFLDFETTGLNIGKDNIIEIGAVKVNRKKQESTFQALIKPTVPISPKIESITGITDEMLKDAKGLAETLSNFVTFCGDSILVAHNTDFDIPWLMTSLLRHNIDYAFKDSICTLVWARRHKEPSCKLGTLSKKFNIEHEQAHRALSDALATKQIFFHFKQLNAFKMPIKPLSEYIPLSNRLINLYKEYVQP